MIYLGTKLKMIASLHRLFETINTLDVPSLTPQNLEVVSYRLLLQGHCFKKLSSHQGVDVPIMSNNQNDHHAYGCPLDNRRKGFFVFDNFLLFKSSNHQT